MKKATVSTLAALALLVSGSAFAEESKTLDPGKPADPAQSAGLGAGAGTQSEAKASGVFGSSATGASLKEQSQTQIQVDPKTEQEAINNSTPTTK
jgi:hypothetical protein